MKNIAIAVLAISAGLASAEVTDTYNFKYAAEGQKSLLPVQVFDDGKQTIFQFRPGQRVPAIFIEQDGGWTHTSLTPDGAYYTLPKTSRAFKLKIGYAEASIKYTGMDRGSSAGIAKGSVENRGFATAAKGDEFAWSEDLDIGEQSVVFIKKSAKVTVASSKQFAVLARKLANAKTIEVYGYSGTSDESFGDNDLGRRRVDAIVNSLTSFGVDRAKIKTGVSIYGASDAGGGEIGARVEYSISKIEPPKKTVAQPTITERVKTERVKTGEVSTIGKQLYRIERGDKTILDVIKRWGRNSGWEVIGVNFPNINLEESVDQEIAYSTFLDAVEKMKEGLKRKGYTKVDGRAYMDNVIEIGVFDDK